MQTEDLFEGIREDAYAQVAVPLPVARPFTYRIPEHAISLVMPGSRVLVNVSGRPLTGIVVATGNAPPRDLAPGKIQLLHDCLDPLPLMSPLLLALTRSVAAQTMSSWGETMRIALPSGLDRVARRRVALTPKGRKAASEEPLAKGSMQTASLSLLEVLLDAKGETRTIGTLMRRVGNSAICAQLYEMAQRGLVCIEDEWSSGVGGRWQDVAMPMRHITRSRALEHTERAPGTTPRY